MRHPSGAFDSQSKQAPRRGRLSPPRGRVWSTQGAPRRRPLPAVGRRLVRSAALDGPGVLALVPVVLVLSVLGRPGVPRVGGSGVAGVSLGLRLLDAGVTLRLYLG